MQRKNPIKVYKHSANGGDPSLRNEGSRPKCAEEASGDPESGMDAKRRTPVASGNWAVGLLVVG